MGFGALQKLFACMNLPGISSKMYKRYENIVGPTVKEVAKNSCKQAADEEKILMIENMEKIFQELSISYFIYFSSILLKQHFFIIF